MKQTKRSPVVFAQGKSISKTDFKGMTSDSKISKHHSTQGSMQESESASSSAAILNSKGPGRSNVQNININLLAGGPYHHQSNKSATCFSNMGIKESQFSLDGLSLDSISLRQSFVEASMKKLENSYQCDIELLREKIETQEKLFSKFLQAICEKYAQLEMTLKHGFDSQASLNDVLNSKIKFFEQKGHNIGHKSQSMQILRSEGKENVAADAISDHTPTAHHFSSGELNGEVNFSNLSEIQRLDLKFLNANLINSQNLISNKQKPKKNGGSLSNRNSTGLTNSQASTLAEFKSKANHLKKNSSFFEKAGGKGLQAFANPKNISTLEAVGELKIQNLIVNDISSHKVKAFFPQGPQRKQGNGVGLSASTARDYQQSRPKLFTQQKQLIQERQQQANQRNKLTKCSSSRNFKQTDKAPNPDFYYRPNRVSTKARRQSNERIGLKETKNSNSFHDLRQALNGTHEENIMTSDYFITGENTTMINLAEQKILAGQQKAHLLDRYQKQAPVKSFQPTSGIQNRMALIQQQRPQTSTERERVNITYQAQLPQDSLIAKPLKINQFQSIVKGSELSSPNRPSFASKSVFAEDASPKFMKFVNGDTSSPPSLENTIALQSLAIDQPIEIGITSRLEAYETMQSKDDLNDLDEGKVVTKVAMTQQSQIPSKKEINIISANSVYETKNMNLSRFISSNKSQVDFKNYYNQVEFKNINDLMLNKGTKCLCIQAPYSKKSQLNMQNMTVGTGGMEGDNCGEFCRKLTQKQQREIIKRLILSENSGLDSSQADEVGPMGRRNSKKSLLAPFSRSRSPISKHPQHQMLIQKPEIIQIESTAPQHTQGLPIPKAEKKYLINSTWWRQWCDYVNFEASTPRSQDFIKPLGESEIDERRRVILQLHQQMVNAQSDLNNSSYAKPGIIKNEILLEDCKSCELKSNLVEHFDFVVVSCEVWKRLYSWYSCDVTLPRFMKRDATNKLAYYLDIYPDKQRFYGGMDLESEAISESESEIFNQSLDHLVV